MRFRRQLEKKYQFRTAELEDSDYLSSLQLDYLEEFGILEIPRSPEKFRIAIGSGLINNEKILVVEDEGIIIGFIEHKRHNPFHARLSYPYVIIDHPDRKLIQESLLNRAIQILNEAYVRYINIEFSSNIPLATDLMTKAKFSKPKSIFQSWEGEIRPRYDIEIDPFDVRRVKLDDLEITYKWIQHQLEKSSPLYISKDSYAALLSSPQNTKEGWALAHIEDLQVAFVSSLMELNSKSIVVFGPFCDEQYIDVRIPLLNELFIYYKMRGHEYVRILRISEFYNDKELFETFGLEKTEEIISMHRIM